MSRMPSARVNVPDDDPLQLLIWDLLGVLPAGAVLADPEDYMAQAAADLVQSSKLREQYAVEPRWTSRHPDAFEVWHSMTTAGRGRRHRPD